MASTAERNERRVFLCSIGAIAGSAALAPLLGGCEVTEMHTDPPQQGVTLDFDVAQAPYQPLAQAGGSVTVSVAGAKVLLVRTDATQIVAMSAVCTHEGGPLSWDVASQRAKCGFHLAEFDQAGAPVKPPCCGGTTSALKTWQVTFDAQTGKGTLSDAIRLDFDVAQAPYTALAQVNGSVEVTFGGRKTLLVRTATTTVIAISAVCTHEGGPLSWDAASQRAKCGFHLAEFDAKGTATKQPCCGGSAGPIKAFPVTFDAQSGKGTVKG
jgi:nitrite reductase/ring-hydroxylating ferredoxin subunit